MADARPTLYNLLTMPYVTEQLATFIGGRLHQCARCLSPLVSVCRLDLVTWRTLLDRTWPFCSTTAELRSNAGVGKTEFVLSVRWHATFEEIGKVHVDIRSISEGPGIEAGGMRAILLLLRAHLGFPAHFLNVVTAYVSHMSIGTFLDLARGGAFVKLQTHEHQPTAVVQLVPPADGIMRGLRNCVVRAIDIESGNPFCYACFRTLSREDTARRCIGCEQRHLCSQCLPDLHSRVCIVCVGPNHPGFEASVLRMRQFWLEVGSEFTRYDYAQSPYSLSPISNRSLEI